MKINTGKKLKCLNNGGYYYWTENREYTIYFDDVQREYYICDDDGDERSEPHYNDIIEFLESLRCKFELVGKTEQQDKTLRELIEEMSAKRDKWNTDSEKLFAKRDRIDEQAEILAQKAADIEAHIDVLKEYL